jgi:Protein of unknown function (DUF3800)
VIEAFFDESGKEGDPSHRFVVMAGYAAGDWNNFQRSWRSLLLKHGLPSIHMKKILGIAKEKGWDLPRLNGVLSEFVSVIKESWLIGFGVGVDVEAYRAIPADIKKQFGDVQIFCCSRILRRLMDHVRAGGFENESLSITFDRDYGFARPRMKLMEELSKRDPIMSRRIAQVSFANSDYFYPLQAADLLAWETRRQLMNNLTDKPSTSRWTELVSVLPSEDYSYAAGEFWTKEWFDHEIPKLRGPIVSE